MNGHAPGSEQLEPLRLRRRLERDLQNPSTSRSSSISTLSETTTSSNEQSQPTTNNPGSSYFHLPRGTLSKLFLIFLLLRSLNALLTTSFFQPDEYWQSLELAHKFVFRFGYATWEWTETSPKLAHNSFFQSLGKGPIRTFAYPSLFVPIYWILKLTRLDNTVMLVSISFFSLFPGNIGSHPSPPSLFSTDFSSQTSTSFFLCYWRPLHFQVVSTSFE